MHFQYRYCRCQYVALWLVFLLAPSALTAETAPKPAHQSFTQQDSSRPLIENSDSAQYSAVSIPTNTPQHEPLHTEQAKDLNDVNNSIARNLLLIEGLEAEGGPFNDHLSQQLVGLGSDYQRREDHEQALNVFKRAIHINRINEGLYNLNQVAILDHIIDSNIALRRWNKVYDINRYLIWLNERSDIKSEAQIKKMLSVVNKISDYHLNQYLADKTNGPFYHLVQAQSLFQLSINIIGANFSDTDPRLIIPLRGLTASNYYLNEFSHKSNTELRNKLQMNIPDYKAPNENYQKYTINNYNTGKNAIKKLTAVYNNNPEFPVSASLKAQVELGDWHLMFDRKRAAFEIYSEVINADIDDNTTKIIVSEWFSEPVALPELGYSNNDRKRNSGYSNNFVEIEFDISAYGKARNIKIIKSFPEDSVRIKNHARDSLRRARFRPRFHNGEAVPSYGLQQRYVFISD